MKMICLFALLLAATATYAQEQPGVNCVPIDGRDWQGCMPIQNGAPPQQPQVPQAPPAIWVDRYGAIVTDEPHGVIGVSKDMQSRGNAINAALADCRAKGGVNCIVQASYGNECVAMIVGGKIFNVNSGSTINRATKKGMKMCETEANDCHAFYTACSLPIRIQ